MSCIGVHFALTAAEAAHLRTLDEESRLEYFTTVIEAEYLNDHPDLTAESDDAWNALHRVLTDGRLNLKGGTYPFGHVVLAGEQLYLGPDFVLSLKTPAQVHDIAAKLPSLTPEEFCRRYFAIDPKDYGIPLSEEDFDHTWDAFEDVRNLYLRAAKEGRFVLFTADQ